MYHFPVPNNENYQMISSDSVMVAVRLSALLFLQPQKSYTIKNPVLKGKKMEINLNSKAINS